MYELFAHNLDIVAGSARFYASRYLPYSELYQEGAAQLMEAVIKQTYFQDASQNFRFIARACVLEHKKRGLGPLMARYSVPLRPPDDYNEYRDTVRAAIEQFRAEHHKAPALDEISAATTMRKDTILGVLAIAEGPVYLDEQPMLSEEIDSKADLLLIDDDFVTGRLDQMEITEAMDTLFRSADLGNVEKLILSLQFGIFHASLSGTTVERSGQELFTYPHSEEDFTALMNTKETGRYARTARLLHRSEKNIAKDLRVALHSAQNALKAFDSLVDKYSNAGQVAEVLDATEQRKTDMVSLALQVSPDAPLTTRQLRALVREGNFPYNEGDVKQTFKTMNAFHVACGFEVDKSQRFKGISVDKILDLAIDLNPKDALNTNEIEILAKHGEFVSTMVIYQRFKSIPAFRDAVRQRIAARQGQ
jgi:DNA-directed RNA polymerase specialized sigma subunit